MELEQLFVSLGEGGERGNSTRIHKSHYTLAQSGEYSVGSDVKSLILKIRPDEQEAVFCEIILEGQVCDITVIAENLSTPVRLVYRDTMKNSQIRVKELHINSHTGKSARFQSALVLSQTESKGEINQYGLVLDGGKILVEGAPVILPQGHKTSNHLSQEGLMMGSDGGIHMTPLLSVAYNDVSAGHSFQMVHLKEEEIIYAQSRGVSRERLQSLLGKSMLYRALEYCPEEDREEWISLLLHES